MARRQSRMLPLGSVAPHFALPDTVSGRTVALEDFASSPALLVAFICNHCPFEKHMLDGFVAFARDFTPRGLAIVAISSNDVAGYPADAPAEMKRVATLKGFSFPYLYDESQEVASAYQAVCTPDFFLFDRERRLVYRGQFDGGRFFGFVIGGSLPVTVAASWLASAWDQNGGLVVTAPINARLEKVALDWVKGLFHLPADSAGGFVTSATAANFCALAAARHALLERAGWDVEAQGLFGAPPITVVVGE